MKEIFKIGSYTMEITVLSQKGSAKNNEDGYFVKHDFENILCMVVDGGTQVEEVPTLKDTTGGKFIAQTTVQIAEKVNIKNTPQNIIKELNTQLGDIISKQHPSISYSPDSLNTPYGSIAAVTINSNSVSVANAGDVSVLALNSDGQVEILTIDDVFQKDQSTLKTATNLAHKYGLSVREVMENRSNDNRYRPVLEEMYKTVKMGNSGEIRRITGAPNFEITAQTSRPFSNISRLYIFSDGAIPFDQDLQTKSGREYFCKLAYEGGLESLYERVVANATEDPDFNKHPRFKFLDDFTIIEIKKVVPDKVL